MARAAPAVVNVYTAKHVDVPLIPLPDDPVIRELLGQLPSVSRRHESTSLGSGVIVQDRYVLTNYHVVEAADAIEVALADGRETRAQVVGADPETDLAVLKLPEHIGAVPVATLGSDGALKVGDVVLAIGNPFGVGQTTTQGIVSALGRSSLGAEHLRKLHPDRRGHQSGQFRRRADRPAWQCRRHQHGHLFAVRRLAGHRLRGPHRYRAVGNGGNHTHRLTCGAAGWAWSRAGP